jgi:hypothetical protein
MSESYEITLSELITASDFSFSKKGAVNYLEVLETLTPSDGPAGMFSNYDYKVTCNGVEYELSSISITETASSLNVFSAEIYGVQQSDSNIAEDKIFRVFIGSTCIFKGTITNSITSTDGYATLTGNDQAIKLKRKSTASMGGRIQYTNTAVNTIVTAICSGAINVGTNTDTSLLTTRGEYDKRLAWLAEIARQEGLDWWVDQDGGDNDQFNFGTRGSPTSTVTLSTYGDACNCNIADRNRDTEHIYNSVYVLGYGDGVNQIVGHAAAFTTNITLVNGAISKSATTIVVDSTALFPASGTLLIGAEKITYSGKTGTSFTGCTRATSSTTATAHFDNQLVFDATYSESSPQTGSSIDVYGLIEEPFNDKAIIAGVTDSSDANYYPEATAQKIAEQLLLKYYLPSEIIQFTYYDTRRNLPAIGDVVTLNDVETGLSSTQFRVVKKERMIDAFNYQDDYLITIANIPPNLYEDLQKSSKSSSQSLQYGQGATNIYCVNNSENCDSTHPMYLRFYLPSEAVAVNRLKLNFKMKNFRADSKSVNVAPKFSQSSGMVMAGGLAWQWGGTSTSRSYLTFSGSLTSHSDVWKGSNASTVDEVVCGSGITLNDDVIEVAGSLDNYGGGTAVVLPSTTAGASNHSHSQSSHDHGIAADLSAPYQHAHGYATTGMTAGVYTGDAGAHNGHIASYWAPYSLFGSSNGNASKASVIEATGVTTGNDFVTSTNLARASNVVPGADTWTGVTLNLPAQDASWGYPWAATAYAYNLAGTFDRIKINAVFYNGFNRSGTVTLRIQKSTDMVTWATVTDGDISGNVAITYSPYSQHNIEMNILTDYRGYYFRIAILTSGELNVNQTADPDLSYLYINVATYISTLESLVYGIYENSGAPDNFTPPGTVTVSTGIEGSEAAVATYSADQANVDLTSMINWVPDNWYVVKFDPAASTYGGRMRIEANLYVQIFIQSK